MSTLALTTSSPAGRASSLLSSVYGQHVPELTIVQGSALSYKTAGGELSTLPEVVVALLEGAGKTIEGLGSSDESQKEVKSWLERIGEGKFEKEDEIKSLDGELSSKTYLVGSSLTSADLSLFAALRPYLSVASHSAHLTHPSVTRHFDHIQNLSLLSTTLPLLSPPGLISIDTDNVPLLEIKPEVKVKKPKAPVAEEGTVASAVESVKEAVKENVVKPVEDAVAGVAGKKGKKEKKEAAPGDKPKRAPAPAPVVEAPAPHMIDLRVGRIVDVKVHPDADSLYVESIDVGEAEPRTVVSGLVKYMTLEQMQGATLITVCNLKPANMRGVKSFAMVLCASSKDGKEGGIEFVLPPEGSKPGDRVFFEGFEDKSPLDLLNPKKKIFETIQPGFTTLENRDAAWVSPEGQTYRIVTDKGVCAPTTLVGASLS